MVRVTVAVLVRLPPTPFTVMVRVPVVAVEATWILMTECPDPGAGIVLGLKATCTPAPCPEAVKATDELKPPETVVVILEWPVLPRAIVTWLGTAVRVKLGVDDEMVTATPADGMPFATTNNWLPPVSIPAGTSKFVDTRVPPVATAMVL